MKAAEIAQIPASSSVNSLMDLFPVSEMVLWVDPHEVSCRIGDYAPITSIYRSPNLEKTSYQTSPVKSNNNSGNLRKLNISSVVVN